MTVYYTREKGSELTEEQKEMLRKAKQMPIVYDEDSPEMDEKMKKAFEEAVKERNRRLFNMA